MVKTIIAAILLAIRATTAFAQRPDAPSFRATDISYAQLDSVIRSNERTVIYYWPNWCTACKRKIPQLVDLMRQHPQVTFISVNDPSSTPDLNRQLLDHPGIIAGHYRIERQGRQQLISINDRNQLRHFNRYYAKSAAPLTSVDYLYMFGRGGTFVHSYSGTSLHMDSVAAALEELNR